jgi:uncharacterized membrane protein YkvA (DUF1232 family)
MTELREFQSAAVQRIVDRLTDAKGSRRFLLADEVGLGKTLVAKGVIDKLRARKARGGFTIVYICSNAEIANQNRSKLCDESHCAVPGRLTLLALDSQQINHRRQNGALQVFAFTPGTSLQIETGTGIAKERRLLLYLLLRVWRKPVNRHKWREFFRCAAGEERWNRETRFRSLQEEFFRSVAGDLQSCLKKQWESQKVQLFNPLTSARFPESKPVADCIDECVDAFVQDDKKNPFVRKNRNLIIGELRKGLARVSLEFLDPQLTILDEFQRFSTILLESRDEKSIVGKLFRKGSGAILILSATPYKMYTLAHENEDHHQDFIKTLAFLRNEPLDGPGLIEIQKDLRTFRERLTVGEWASADDPVLLKLRDRIQGRLKEVMCRTERNWYLEDAAKGVKEVLAGGVSPQKTELVEYCHLRHFLLSRRIGEWNITDFWKSSPSVVSFMDGQYALIKNIRRERLALPATVLRPEAHLPEAAKHNAKVRLLFSKIFGDAEDTQQWKYLWVRPTYTYYKDDFYRDNEPTKYLVFSHWRFVPKAVSVLTSHEALNQIGRTRRRLQSSPLQFREKTAFYAFDICYPSLPLANAVNHFCLTSESKEPPTGKVLFIAARRALENLLAESGIQRSKTRTAPLWKIIARMEGRSSLAGHIRESLMSIRQGKAEETAEYLPRHVAQYLAWMEDDSLLAISQVWLDRLTRIALYSPAISSLRTFLSIFPEHQDGGWRDVLPYSLGPLRHYFNKRLVQIIVRRHGSGKSYTEKILSYCEKAHFQAMLDEYAYLVRHVLQHNDSKEFLSHIARALGMWAGLPGVNGRTRSGRISRRSRPQPAHFALSFGDDVSSELVETDGNVRKSAVRDAFNSPFWPFVLATTSVGQEGLDFHLYCRDIVHWNLPSNPVDLEQREGRINRYDGLSIRRNIARDFPLSTVSPKTGGNLWSTLFDVLTESHGYGRFKRGLFPHWIYQGQNSDRSEPADQSIIRRHLLFYSGSKDRQRYNELKEKLALYRLVFGQPRQQDILEQVLAQCETSNLEDLNRSLSKYTINLSPFPPAYAQRRAKMEAARLLSDPTALRELLENVPEHMTQIPKGVLDQIQAQVTKLVILAKDTSVNVERRRQALAAILYLLDPYDAVPDWYGVSGYPDDIAVLRKTHAAILRN